MSRTRSAVLAGQAAAGLLVLFFPAQGAAQPGEPAAISSTTAKAPVLHWRSGRGRSYLIPALEIPSFLLALTMYDRTVYGQKDFGSTPSTLWHNINHAHWVYDTDSFSMNQFGHPYLGSMMYGFARSSGLSFFESLLYSDAGSLLWELGGETTDPSMNDLIVTSQSGALLGEALFRMSSLTLERGDGDPGFWRQLGAAAISPPTALNRLLFGERFKTLFPRRNPSTYTSMQLTGNLQKSRSASGVASDFNRRQVGVDFTMSYGLPGKDGYKYTRPFDYFNFKCTTISGSDILENIMVRGLLTGRKYESGDNYRGIWGLYATYDYLSPTVFRVSNTSLALGTNGQWWLTRRTALQGAVLAGPGYGAGGTVPAHGLRNYHLGASLYGLLSLRLIVDKALMLNVNIRAYDISGIRSPESGAAEMIARSDASITVPIYGPHSVGFQYVESRRYSHFPTYGGVYQKVGMTSVAYIFSFEPHFGAVEWRDGMDSGNR
ncbi:MAG: DUF3943 domain-containing protein [Elusimicrobia bacterium]|nr:DUF3943 domain-containing protein [Elusimicrobiota bacterium]